MYDLFERFAPRYDLHTPPGHYKHDHALVLDTIRQSAVGGNRLFDVGCGTGVFIEAALAAGLDAYGADAAAGMVEAATRRLGPDRVKLERMQDLDSVSRYDAVCSLSWTIHYCEDAGDLQAIVRRCARALKPAGILLLQIANAAAVRGAVRVDREPGPAGEPGDTLFIHRFTRVDGSPDAISAEYIYASQALDELMVERHLLRCCDPEIVVEAMRMAGLSNIEVVNETSIAPFVIAGQAGTCRERNGPWGKLGMPVDR